ncbi:unnamed protein product [Ambrosiozyma monospora]|uniref:Unnamed protein product n=1 Tax=Ambrosiozyma monospora TaxID=43982 RepID=A0ACB5T9C2_AMBMO|nr:unnamed protein product [Ambrosiozyma monospora]
MQMNMLTDMQIGLDAANIGAESLFNIKTAAKTGELDALAKGKKSMIINHNDLAHDVDIVVDDEHKPREIDSADELDDLEQQLDDMHHHYKEAKMERDAKLRAKEARGGDEDEAWEGIQDDERQEEVSDSDEGDFESDNESEIDSDDDEAINKLLASIEEKKKKGKLSSKANNFFNDSIFKGVNLDVNTATTSRGHIDKKQKTSISSSKESNTNDSDSDSSDEESDADSDSDFEVVPNTYGKTDEDADFETDSEDERDEKERESHKKDIDIATVEAMTLAHQLALGHKNKANLMDDGFNKYSFREKEGLPEWFLEDEGKHSKINRPITKEAALAIKEKMKQLNARPIKKVMEAQGRKKMRAMRRLEKLRKKSDLIADDDSKSELDKANEIQGLVKKMSGKKKPKPKVRLVVATGNNKGLSGRPRGIKGKYKMVDGVLKNEMRALKRIEKKHKKKKKHRN